MNINSLREGEKRVVRIPVVRDVLEVRVALAVVLVQHDHVLVTIGIHPDPQPCVQQSSEPPPVVRPSG